MQVQSLDAEQLNEVMVPDESSFRCVQSRYETVRRSSGSSRYDSRFTVKTV